MSEDNKEGVYLTSKQFITLGNKSEDKVEVTEGLALGDIVVLEGAYSVEDSQRVKLID
jgi:multidrug efflux pump subunit AcrA (membrane-fusion protein)